MNAAPVADQLSPEQALLVACVQGDDEPQTVRGLVRAVQDWETALAMASWHGLMPLLYEMVAVHARTEIPQPYLERLERAQRAATGHGTFLAAEMIRIIKLLDRRGIAAMPYKAGALAALLYDAVAQRPMLDIDLLVRRGDVPAARAALVEDGYLCTDSDDPRTEAEYVRDECEYHFRHPHHRTLVEIHWDVLPRYAALRLDLDAMHARATERSLFGAAVRVMTPEDLLLVLCAHGSKHRWNQLKWLRDLRQVTALYPDLNWSLLAERARGCGALRVLLLSLRLAEMLAGVRLPDAMRRVVAREPGVRRLAARLRPEILAWPPLARDTLADVGLQMRLRERWLDRLRYAFLVVGSRSRVLGAGQGALARG